MNINYSIFTLLIPLIIQITPCSGTAKLMLQFDSFENIGFLKENGECCDGERRNGNCTGRCDYSIRVCLTRNATGDPCEIQRFNVGTVDVATSSFDFPSTFVSGFANPVPISLNRWQGDVIVSVSIYDEDTLREERVDTYNLTYTRFAPVSNRPIENDDFLPYSLVGKRDTSPTRLDIAVTVQCDRFFYGVECLVNCVENDDCNGHYTCNPVTGEKICNEGWGGDNCSISLSADHGCFASQTCANRAECVRYGNAPSEFYCCCAPGYTGSNCELDIDECASGPCENGGSCIEDEPNSYECVCPIRYKGVQCEIQRNCDDDPCLNGGLCRSVVGSFFCICNENYTGEICESPTATTTVSTTPEMTTPSCPTNYFGPSCSVFCQPQDDCSGHYVCDNENGNKICNPTWGGVNCTERNFVDATCPCQNGGQCFDNQCCCPEGFSGSLCDRRVFCNVERCLNGGQCYEENNGFRCACRQGFAGENCETEVQICPAYYYGPSCSVYCRPQEDCSAGQWSCNPNTGERQCRFGWMGSMCNARDPTARHRVACPDSDCRNGGICANSTCCCPVGYTGSLCHIEILECASTPCQNNARCEDLIGDYLCICRPGYSGKNCESFIGFEGSTTTEEPDPCLNVNCFNGGTCASNSSTAAICLCREGFIGDLCEISARTTLPGQQICPQNFYGPNCQIFCREEDSCERGHFYCDQATGQRICKNGWIGTICNTRVLLQEYDPECPVVGCRNRGQCFNGTCCCSDSSQGEYCQEETLACDTLPCQNGGTCLDLVNGYTCACRAGYTGVDCATIVETTTASTNNNSTLEACDQDRCLNGGVCIPTLLPFSCLCPNPFSGRYCEINIAGTSTTTYLQTIYLRGNISDNNQGAIQEILQRAVNASATSSTCCVVVYIVEKTSYVDQAGDVVVGYVYNVTHSNGGTITPGQTDSLNNEVNNELQRTDPFRQDRVVVYTGPVQGLTNIEYAYTVDFIGDIPESRRQAVIQDIEDAWRNANPDCRCQFTANIATTEQFAGEYGIKVSRVYYTITRDGQRQDPATTQPPSRNVFFNTVQLNNSVNSVYSGTFLLPYNQRHTILLNGDVDIGGDQGTQIRNTIQSAWIQWRNTNPSVPPNLRNAQVDIIMLRPQAYYTQDGRRLSRLEYFVVLNNTIIIGPQSANIGINSPLFCTGCDAIPVPFVDIKGSLPVDQIRTLGANLNPSDPGGVSIDSMQFINSNGEAITRIYYRPPISGPGVQSTAVSQERLAQILTILNLEQPSLPIERTFAVTFAGTITDNDQEGIRQTLTDAWADTYGIPRELISVTINSMDGTFTSASGNSQLTQVSYTVSIQGADSHLTRFQGLDLATLRRYFSSPSLVVVGGQGTLPTLETTPSVNGLTTVTPTTSAYPYLVETIYLRGNISDNNQGSVEEILQNALNKSRTGSPCCVTLHIIERTTYTDPSGQTIIGYTYNISSSNGTTPSSISPEQRRNFTSEINNGLQTVDYFRQLGVVMYTDPIEVLRRVGFTYTVDFIGDVPESRRQAIIAAIEEAWNAANPGCNCRFEASIGRTDEFSGDYGIKVSRVIYTMRRDGQLQDPNVVPPPTRTIFYTTALRDTNSNSVYSGSSLTPYNQHHSVLLNGVNDLSGAQGTVVKNALQSAWIQFRDSSPTLPPNLRNLPLDIVMLRPQKYYTPDGRELTKVDYYVVLNQTIVIGPQAANISMTNPMFCDGCTAVPVPCVDVNGRLSPDQLLELGLNLDPTDTSGENIDSEIFVIPNGGTVTRVCYRPPISGTDVQSTAVSQQRLNQILVDMNLNQPTLPTERTFTLNFAGSVGDNNRDTIQETIANAWATTHNIPRDAISVKVSNMDDNYVSSTSNSQVTQVTYTVSVQGADSQWTRFTPVDVGTLGGYFIPTGLFIVREEVTNTQTTGTPGGATTAPTTSTTPYLVETIYFRGNISDNNQGSVEEILQTALNKSRTGTPCCVTLHIIERTTYTDPSGQTIIGYTYNISSSNGTTPSTITPEQRRNFTSEVNNGLQTVDYFRQLGVVMYTDPKEVLRRVGFTYTVDFIGDVPESRRQAIIAAIEEAWNAANPGCNCQFEASIDRTDEFSGDYGIKVSRVIYTMRRDGQLQDPTIVAPPTRTIFYTTALRDTNSNSVYSGSSLTPYNQHHSVLLNGVNDLSGAQGTVVRNALRSAWIQFRDSSPALPPNLRNLPLDIVMLRPQKYYTTDGRELTRVDYYVVLNQTIVIGPQAANISMTNPMFCDGCSAVPVPCVDINGRLSPDQLLELGLNLDRTDANGENVDNEIFLTPTGGTVTRVCYRPPISGTDVQSTAVSQQRLNQILNDMNMNQPTLPTGRTFTLNFAGSVGDNNRDVIEETIINAWATTHNIPRDAISVKVSNMDDNYVSSTSNSQVTQVTYTVSVQGADSQWTRFAPVDVGTLGGYFIPTGLFIVREEVINTQTTETPGGATTAPTTSTTPYLVDTIYFRGNISDNNQGSVEEILQTALNKSRTGSPCCVTLHIIERTTYTDPSGQTVIGYTYNISSSNGTTPSTITPEQRRNFTSEVNNGLQTVDYFRQLGVVMYTDPIEVLRRVGFTYTVDFIGDVPESRRQAIIAAIEEAWNAANPGCNCQFEARIDRTDEFTGDYGIKVSRVIYTMRRDGQIQDPNVVPPPTRTIFYTTALRDSNSNSVYSGSSLTPYNQHHSVLLNGINDLSGVQGTVVRNALQSAWIQFRDSSPALPPNLRNLPLDIVMLRPQKYYTTDGRELTRVDYYVVLNQTIVIGPQAANISMTNPMFCDGCSAVPVPCVDINGRLSPDQLLELGLNLDPTDTNGENIDNEIYLTPNGGTVTRVCYRPPISGTGVQSTAVSQQRLNQILVDMNLNQPTLPTERTFTLNFAGSVGDNNRDTIQETIANAWAAANNIPRDAISVRINNMDDSFVSSPSNSPVTQVTYTVSVQGADSQWTRFAPVDVGVLGGYFIPTGLVIVREEVINTQTTGVTTVSPGVTTPSSNATFLIQTIFLRGNISDNNQAAIEDLLQTAMNRSVNGTCCRTIKVLDKVTFLDPLGNVVVGYRYNVSNTTGGIVSPLRPEETLFFETEVQNQLQRTMPFRQFGTVLYLGNVNELTSVQFTYMVDFIGDIPFSWRPAVIDNIERAWQAANPGCGCVFRGNFVYTSRFSGDYGITVSRVYYTMTSDGRTQDPSSVQPPVWTTLASLVRGDNRVNSLYSGAVLLPYRLRHNVLLSSVVDMNSNMGKNVRSAIETAWLNWRDTSSAVPPSLRTAALEIVLLRPQLYYTQDGRNLSYLEYFVVLNGTFIIEAQSADVPLTGALFCDSCNAIPVPFIEVRGHLTSDQLQNLGSRLNPADSSGSSASSESYINTNGDLVTRVYYQPRISRPDVQSTAISQQRLNLILNELNLKQPSLPIQRTFTMNFAGDISNNNRDVIRQTILNAWAETFNIPVNALSIDIVNMDDNYISTTSNDQATQVSYRVTIQAADSHWTRFEGLSENTLDNYFRPTSIIIIRGEVQFTGTTVTPGPTPPTTSPTNNTQTIYVRGNVTTQNQTVVEEIIQNALNRSRNGAPCCLTVHIVEWTSYVDGNGDSVIGYKYNVTNGSEPVTLTPEQVSNLTREVNNEILTLPYINYGYVIYTGSLKELMNVNVTYTVDFTGDIPDSQRQAIIDEIENAWQTANPGCGCVYTASVLHIEEYNGDYGTKVNRVYYTITRDGQVQDPAYVQPPTQAVFQTTSQEDNSVNPVYSGSKPLPYNKRHTVLLSSVVNMYSAEGSQVQNAIRTTWINWRNTDPLVSDDLRNAPVDIIYLRPQTFYTQDGRNLTNVEYFVLLNNTVVIGPQTANVSLTDPLFCNCAALPVPFVDVNGPLTRNQLQNLGSNLNPSDPSGSTMNSQVFVTSNNDPVTRVYYRPPISGPEVQSTAVSQQRLTEILTNLNLQQPSVLIEKTFAVNLAGSVGEKDRDTIERTIRTAWNRRYGISSNDLSVSINNMDDSFVSTASNEQVTQVSYTVSVQGVDSHWTRFEGVGVETLGQYFTNPDLAVVLGEVTNTQTPRPPFTVNTIYLRGNISDNNRPDVERILQNALNRSMNGSSCCLTLHIIEQTTYMDPSGKIVTGYNYNVSNSTGGAVIPMTPDEITDFRREVSNELQITEPFRQFGMVLYTGSIQDLIYVQYTYAVDFIGDIPESQRRAVISDIEKAWRTANPDCRCLYKVNIVTTRDYTGEYGIKVNRVYYTITKDGQIQKPATTQAPSHSVFVNTVQRDNSVNSMYSGSSLLPYNQHHSVLLNDTVDMSSAVGTQVRNAIQTIWTNWRNVHPAVPESLRNAPIEIRLLRTQPYYTQDGRLLTKLEYFVVLNGTMVIGPESTTPSVTGQFFCDGCDAISVPFIDVKGQLSPNQQQELASALNPSDPSGSTVITQSFVDFNNETVTRVYYRPPISGPDVKSTAVSTQRLTEILTNLKLQQPSLPVDRTFAVNFAGSISYNNRNNIEQTIRNVWSGTFGIPSEALTVTIVDMDDNYVSATSNDKVTKVTYTVTIQGADSYWTRFEGDPGTLGRYFTSTDLVVVGGEVIYTQYQSSTPDPSSSSSPTATPTATPTTGSKFIVQTVHLRGNVSDNNVDAIATILQTAMNRSMNGMSCCVMVEILDKITYADPTGAIIVGYRYNMTNSTGGTVSNLAPEQTNNFRSEVNKQLQRTEPFRQDGVVVYTGSVQGLVSLGVAHYVDLIGSAPDGRRTSVVSVIDGAWSAANPDCDCQYNAEILVTVPLSGDYGIAVTRVYYNMKRDGQIQSPINVPAPAREILVTTAQEDVNINSLYSGSSLLPYNQRHSVLLNRAVDVTGSQGKQIQQALLTVWNTWRNNNQNFPESMRTARLEIILLRPQTYYTQEGTTISNVEYFVVIDGTILIGPSTASPSMTGPLFCGCEALPVPYVDVKGQLQWSKLLQLGSSLNPEDNSGSSLDRETYFDANGEPVTRIFYRPPITGSNVKSTAVAPERITEILASENLEQPSIPIRKSFTFYFDGSLGDDHKGAIEEGIMNAWGGSFAIPTEDISVTIIDMSDNFYNTNGNGQVTRVTYTLSIQEADSRWTRYEGLNNQDLNQFFKTNSPDVTPCGCTAREGREIMVTGTVGNDTSGIETALINAWREANPDYTGTLAVGITQVEGATPTTLKYVVTPTGGPSAFMDTDLTAPSEGTLNNQLQPLDLTVYKGDKGDDSNSLHWAIPVGIILALLLLLIIIIIIVLVIRNRRHRMSHTLKQKPEEMNGYDKQHFSDEPHFENPTFDMEDPELGNNKQRTYVVNEEPNMEEIKLR